MGVSRRQAGAGPAGSLICSIALGFVAHQGFLDGAGTSRALTALAQAWVGGVRIRMTAQIAYGLRRMTYNFLHIVCNERRCCS